MTIYLSRIENKITFETAIKTGYYFKSHLKLIIKTWNYLEILTPGMMK